MSFGEKVVNYRGMRAKGVEERGGALGSAAFFFINLEKMAIAQVFLGAFFSMEKNFVYLCKSLSILL